MMRTRFVVDRVIREVKAPQPETQTVVLKPAHGPGEIQLAMPQGDIANQFVLGATYVVEFTKE